MSMHHHDGRPAAPATDKPDALPDDRMLGEDLDPGPGVRRLRLSQILIDLAADAQPLTEAGLPGAFPVQVVPHAFPAHKDPAGPHDAAVTPHAPDATGPADAVTLDRSPHSGGRRRRRTRRPRRPRIRSNITIGEILDRTSHAGFGVVFGFLAALLALIAIPFFGLSTPFGLAIVLIGVQMVGGLNRPWLPRRMREHVVAMSTLDWISRKLARWTAGMEKWIKPRFTILTRGPFWTLIGVGIIVQGCGLALPLPIPGSNWPFIIVVLIYSIGLLEDDGLLILVGHACTAIMIVLGIVFWQVIYEAVAKAVGWFGGLF